MKSRALILAFLTMIVGWCQNHLAADGILAHGSLASLEDWYRDSEDPKKGLFFKELSSQANRLGLGKIVSFSWSGKSGLGSRTRGVKEHIKAAEAAAKMIRNGLSENPPAGAVKLNPPLYFIGHSNGGVVGEIMSQMLYNPHSAEAESLGLQAPPLFGKDLKAVRSKKSRNGKLELSVLEERADRATRECRGLLKREIERVRKEIYGPNDRSQIKIEQLIMIATPIDQSLYSVNTRVVNKICSLFSSGDGLQRYFGRGQVRYPQGDNVMNFRVAVRSPGGGIYYPLHTQMRNEYVARYLLSLMSDVPKMTGVSPSKFASTRGVDVLFDEQPDDDSFTPEYSVIENLRERAFPASGLE